MAPTRPPLLHLPALAAVVALTGNASLIVQDQRVGLELAQAEFGQPTPALSLKLEDGGSDEQTATTASRRLLQQPLVALIGPSHSQQAFAVDPIADRAAVPVRAALPLAELRRALNTTLLQGAYDTPLGDIRFTPEGDVIQKEFYVAHVQMDASGKTGRLALLPKPSPTHS